jgi:CcmD family protein
MMAKGLSYVLAVTLITWLGLFLYLLRLDLRLREAERREEI